MSKFDTLTSALGLLALVLSAGVIGFNCGMTEAPDSSAYEMCAASRLRLLERLDSSQRKLWACERGVRLPPEAP